MKHKIYRFFLFVGLITLSAFTLVPPVHQIPEGHKYVPEVVMEKPPVDSMTIAAGNVGAKKGEQVCVPITVYEFNNILSMQFSISWDSSALQFSHLENFGMRDITDNNFGKSMVDEGYLAFLWYDQHLLGKSQKDGFKLYDVCFEVLEDAEAETIVEISDHPTVGEVVNGSAVFLRLHKEHGTVEVVQ